MHLEGSVSSLLPVATRQSELSNGSPLSATTTTLLLRNIKLVGRGRHAHGICRGRLTYETACRRRHHHQRQLFCGSITTLQRTSLNPTTLLAISRHPNNMKLGSPAPNGERRPAISALSPPLPRFLMPSNTNFVDFVRALGPPACYWCFSLLNTVPPDLTTLRG